MLAGLFLRALLSLALQDDLLVETGRLSVYRPGDGWNAGTLSCGGKFTHRQVHIAHRRWRRIGCGTPVIVCSKQTGRCVTAPVRDAGPFGIYRGPLKGAVRDGRWKVWVKSKPPPGWKWRGVADLSWGLWKKLGRPRFLSEVTLIYRPRKRRGR